MNGIIYKATSPSGKVYIGQTIRSLQSRKYNHASKNSHSAYFHNAIKKHGIDNFQWEQIDTAETKEELDAREKFWIAYYDSTTPAKGYNRTSGGVNYNASAETRRKQSVANIGKRHTAEARKKMSKAKKGKPSWNKGKPSSPETCQKLSNLMKGKKLHLGFSHSAITKQKISEAKKGHKMTEAQRLGIIERLKGHSVSTETRQKLSITNRGKGGKLTEATARQIKLDLQAGMRICDIAKKNSVSASSVKCIKQGKSWSWLKISA